MLYQIRLDGNGALLHLPIPHKRVQIYKASASAAQKVASGPKVVPSSLESREDHETVEHLLGGVNVLDEMQDICDTAWHEHVVGAHALQMARLRHLARACDKHGVRVSGIGMHGSLEEVRSRLQVALHLALQLDEGDKSEATAAGDRYKAQQEAEQDKKYSGVRIRISGTKEEKEFNKWEAFIEIGNQAYNLGYFAHKAEAARAWDMAAKRMMPRTTQLNLPDSGEFLPSQELMKTLDLVVAAAATRNRVRVAPQAPAGTVIPGQVDKSMQGSGKILHAVRRVRKVEREKKLARKKRLDRLGKRLQKARCNGELEGQDGLRRSCRRLMPAADAGDRRGASTVVTRHSSCTMPTQRRMEQPLRQAVVTKRAVRARGPVGSDEAPAPASAPAPHPAVAYALPPPPPPPPTLPPPSGLNHDNLLEVLKAAEALNASGQGHVQLAVQSDSGAAAQDPPAQSVPDANSLLEQAASQAQGKEREADKEQAQETALDEVGIEGPVTETRVESEAVQAAAKSEAVQAAAKGVAACSGKHPARIRKKRRLFGEEDAPEEELTPRQSVQMRLQQRMRSGSGVELGEAAGAGKADGKEGVGCGAKKKIKTEPAESAAEVLPEYTAAGAQCEILWEGEWWAATVLARKPKKLRVSYVGGTKEDDEWIAVKDWQWRIRGPQEEAVDDKDGDACKYQGVERSPEGDGLWHCVVMVQPPGAGAGALLPQLDTGPGGASGERAEGVLAKSVGEGERHVLGAFTSAREAAVHWDCAVLELYGCADTAAVRLNLESSRDYFLQHQAEGRSFLPASFDAGMRAAVKDALILHALSESAKTGARSDDM